MSYADLIPVQQRLFRRLGLVPGPSIDACAAAALDGTSLTVHRADLDEHPWQVDVLDLLARIQHNIDDYAAATTSATEGLAIARAAVAFFR